MEHKGTVASQLEKAGAHIREGPWLAPSAHRRGSDALVLPLGLVLGCGGLPSHQEALGDGL